MKRCGARLIRFVLLVLLMLNVSSVYADDKTVTENGEDALGKVLDLLREKKVISSEESAAFVRQTVYRNLAREDLKALLNLLREKGVVTSEEAAAFVRDAGNKPVAREGGETGQTLTGAGQEEKRLALPGRDADFTGQLRELWIKKGNRGVDFDNQFGEIRDPEEIIGRMRVIGVITPAYADKLDKFYRDKYLSGAVTTVMENKEKDYIDRIRNDVSWEIDDKIKNTLANEWWQRIHLGGDFRLRYEGDYFDKNNGVYLQPTDFTSPVNTTVNRDRIRVRARLGVDARLLDGLEAGVGLATGTTTNPSPNVTLGDSSQGGSLNNKTIVLNKAYLKWSPTPSLAFWGGRFVNPWFYTDLVWYPDLNFDGIAVQYKSQASPAWSHFFTAGAFPIQEVELSMRDKWLFGGQLGAQYKPSENLRAKLGVAYYHYQHTQGIVNDPSAATGLTDFTAPLFQQKGNTLMDIHAGSTTGLAPKSAYASNFHELNITGQLDLAYWDPVHVIFTGDYVKNLAFNRNEVEAAATYPSSIGESVRPGGTGYQFGVTVGHPVMEGFGDWKTWFAYKRLESDAVIDAFTDTDFHLGGTNAKGWIVGGEFGLAKNVWLTSRWISTDAISGDPFAVDMFFFDVNAKF